MTEPNATVSYEPRDVNSRAILVAAGALAAVVVLVALACWWLHEALAAAGRKGDRPLSPIAAEERGGLPSPPLLEGVARMEGETPTQTVRDRPVQRYEWRDRDARIAQIPVEEAMRLIAEHHLLPSRPHSPQSKPPSQANSGRFREEKRP